MTAFLIIKTIILLGLANNYNHLGATRLVAELSIISSAPSLYANLRVPTRVYDVEGGAIFSKNGTFVFFDGTVWTSHLRSPSLIMAPDFRFFYFCTIPKGCSEITIHYKSKEKMKQQIT